MWGQTWALGLAGDRVDESQLGARIGELGRVEVLQQVRELRGWPAGSTSRKAYPSDVTDQQWDIIRPLIPVHRLINTHIFSDTSLIGSSFHEKLYNRDSAHTA